MRHDDLDRILSSEQEIIPSAAFVDSVMSSVRREAGAPPPIPFPWRRALPGLCAAGIALTSALTFLIRGTANQPIQDGALSAFSRFLQVWKTVRASWIAMALLLTLTSVMLFSRR